MLSEASPTPPRGVLSISPTVPFEGIPHAGGQYYLRHLREVQKIAPVTLLAPASPANARAADQASWRVHLVAPHAVHSSALARPWALIENYLRAVTPGAGIRTALLQRARQLLPGHDIVELHWPHYMGLAGPIRQAAPTPVRIMGIPYDSLTQKTEREQAEGSLRTRTRAIVSLPRIRAAESRAIRFLDDVIVFSTKDAELLEAQGVDKARIHVIDPPLDGDAHGRGSRTQQATRSALFVAAFDREVNHVSALWLVREVWPKVLALMPDARLVLAGAGARAELLSVASDMRNIEITGYLASLNQVYERATVAVVPVKSGAGLKFKVATSMLAGLPVISTSIGAEGYPTDQGLFFKVCDEPEDFAIAVVEALNRTQEELRKISESARVWATDKFSESHFGERLRSIYCG